MANVQMHRDYGIMIWFAVLLPLVIAAALDNSNVTNVNPYPGINILHNHIKKNKYVNNTSNELGQLETRNSSKVIQTQNLTSKKELRKSNVHKFRTLQENGTKSPFYKRIHTTLTQSKDAVWATITLTFMCIILLLAVAQSKMWKDYHGSEAQGIPLPNFNERVPFKEVMQRKMATLKELLARGKKKSVQPNETELELLLQDSE